MTVISIVIGAFGTVSRNLEKKLDEIEIGRLIEATQTIALLLKSSAGLKKVAVI